MAGRPPVVPPLPLSSSGAPRSPPAVALETSSAPLLEPARCSRAHASPPSLSPQAGRLTSSTSPASGAAAAWTSLHPTAMQAAATAAAGRACNLCLAVARPRAVGASAPSTALPPSSAAVARRPLADPVMDMLAALPKRSTGSIPSPCPCLACRERQWRVSRRRGRHPPPGCGRGWCLTRCGCGPPSLLRSCAPISMSVREALADPN
jgi:hypothetical protein